MAAHVDYTYIPSFSTTEGSSTNSSRSTRPEYSSSSTWSSDYISRPSYSTSDHISQKSHGKIRSSDRPLSSRYDYISRPAQSESDRISPIPRKYLASWDSRKPQQLYHDRQASYPNGVAQSQTTSTQPGSRGFSVPYEDASNYELVKSGWDSKHDFMHSYGLKPRELDGYDDANAILDGFRDVDRQAAERTEHTSRSQNVNNRTGNYYEHDDYTRRERIPNSNTPSNYIPNDYTPNDYIITDSTPKTSIPNTYTPAFSQPHSSSKPSDPITSRPRSHHSSPRPRSRHNSDTRSDIAPLSDICSLHSRSRSRSRSRPRRASPVHTTRYTRTEDHDDEDDISVSGDAILDTHTHSHSRSRSRRSRSRSRSRGSDCARGYTSDNEFLRGSGGSDIVFYDDEDDDGVDRSYARDRGSDVVSCRGSDVVDGDAGSDGILDDDGYMEGWGSDVCGLSDDDED